jgi:hypothetical protein
MGMIKAEAIEEFVGYYNNQRYHESLDNMTPASIYYGRSKEVLSNRALIKKVTLEERRRRNLQPPSIIMDNSF